MGGDRVIVEVGILGRFSSKQYHQFQAGLQVFNAKITEGNSNSDSEQRKTCTTLAQI